MNETARRYLATAAYHDKMARIFRSMKREADAKAAEEAAKKCRAHALAQL